MTNVLADLDRLERDAFRRFYEDGLTDVFFGAMLVVMGISAVIADRVDNEALSMLVMLVLGVIVTVPLLVTRRVLLRTRLGEFAPGPVRRRRIRGTRLVLLASVVVGVIAFGAAAAAYGGDASVDLLEALLPIVWFVNAVVVFAAMAYLLDVPRFYVYGVLFGLVMPVLIWTDIFWDVRVEPWVALSTPGLAVIGVGVYKLRLFLKRYPAPDSEAEPNHGRS